MVAIFISDRVEELEEVAIEVLEVEEVLLGTEELEEVTIEVLELEEVLLETEELETATEDFTSVPLLRTLGREY